MLKTTEWKNRHIFKANRIKFIRHRAVNGCYTPQIYVHTHKVLVIQYACVINTQFPCSCIMMRSQHSDTDTHPHKLNYFTNRKTNLYSRNIDFVAPTLFSHFHILRVFVLLLQPTNEIMHAFSQIVVVFSVLFVISFFTLNTNNITNWFR